MAEPASKAANIDESVFVDDRSLHLTLAVMKLYSPEKREKAMQVCAAMLLQKKQQLHSMFEYGIN